MSRLITTKDIELLCQHDKNIYYKIEILNLDGQVINVIQDSLKSFDYSNDTSSDIRRTVTLNLLNKNKKFSLDRDSVVWLDKKAKVSIGYKYTRTNEIVWYSLGIYLFTNRSYSVSPIDDSVTVQCSDMMSLLQGDRGGEVSGRSIKIPYTKPIRQAVVDTVTQLGNIKDYIIDDVASTLPSGVYDKIPYDLEFSTGATVYDIVSKIRDLYNNWQIYFDIDGVFHFQKIPVTFNEPCVLDETIFGGLVLDESGTEDYKEYKNCIIVYGKDTTVTAIVKEVATAPTPTQITTDQTYEGCTNISYVINPQSPFCIRSLGDRTQEMRKTLSGDTYEKIETNALATERAKYELWLRTRYVDTITLKMLFVPFLDTNQKIKYTSIDTNETNQYIIKKINMSSGEGTSTVELMRFYEEYPFTI